MLIIDDVQFLTGRRETQSEMLRLFNALQGSGRQIVMTSDRPPGDIPDVDERLLTRLSGGLIVDVGRHEVLRDGQAVTLTPTEFDLLALLSASPGRVISRTEMIQKVWGQGAALDLRSVDAHVYRLRRKVEPAGEHPTYIHAVPGIGYRFDYRPAGGLATPLASS